MFPGVLLIKATNLAWTCVSYLVCDWLWMDAGERGHRRHHKRRGCHKTGKRLMKGHHTDYRQLLQEKLDWKVRLLDAVMEDTCTGQQWSWTLTWWWIQGLSCEDYCGKWRWKLLVFLLLLVSRLINHCVTALILGKKQSNQESKWLFLL